MTKGTHAGWARHVWGGVQGEPLLPAHFCSESESALKHKLRPRKHVESSQQSESSIHLKDFAAVVLALLLRNSASDDRPRGAPAPWEPPRGGLSGRTSRSFVDSLHNVS